MAEPFHVAWQHAQLAHGWYEEDEAALLYEACRGTWCEIGAWKGRSTAVLAATGHHGFVIDTFTGSSEHGQVHTYDDYMGHMAGFGNVTTICGDYRTVADSVPDGLALLHLDHEHSWDDCRAAFDLYAHKISSKGLLAVHDAWERTTRYPDHCSWPEVTRFCLELAEHPDWMLWDDCARLAVFQRR